MNLLKRIQRAWKLSTLPVEKEEVLERLEELHGTLDKEQIKAIEELGDGKAEFINQGTTEDFIEWEKEQTGIKKWFEQLIK